MRQLTYIEAGLVQWRDADEPVAVDAGAAIVRPLAVARCDLDPIMAGLGMFPGPFVVGHETVAEVVEVGDAVVDRHAGERVLVPFQVSCGQCVACRDGRYGACLTYRARAGSAFGFGESGGGHGGAMSDLLVVPHADHLLIPAPTDVPSAALCTLPDNVVDGYRAVGPQLLEHPGAEVLVLGGAAASIGLYAVACAVSMGAGSVRYVDSDEERCSAAAVLGASVTLQEGPLPRRFDRSAITVENTATAEGLECAILSTDDYGYCTSVAIHFTPVALPLLQMYTKGVTFHTSRADSRKHLPDVLALVGQRRLDPLMVPTTVCSWEDADRAWLEPATKLVFER